ncbi:hypothetical protein XB02_18725 [Pantoea ananatis]|nr:hypothetical protein XB02_18725 [Pantoea ananatis]
MACLAIVFFVRPVWQFTEKLSYYIDDILNATGVAMADGEFDPAGLVGYFWYSSNIIYSDFFYN